MHRQERDADREVPGVGYQVYLEEGGEEVGAVREIHRDHLLVYVENAGDFRVGPDAIRAVHDGKVILDAAQLDEVLRDAIAHAHDQETM
jgi:hypothetical protein